MALNVKNLYFMEMGMDRFFSFSPPPLTKVIYNYSESEYFCLWLIVSFCSDK